MTERQPSNTIAGKQDLEDERMLILQIYIYIIIVNKHCKLSKYL